MARWGGDEFLVGVWHAEEEEGPPAERVLGTRRRGPAREPGGAAHGEEALLTFSGGVGRWRPGDEAGKLLSRADEALYRAKAKGGGTIEHAD
jgi:PleD family two-component response regulator